MCAVWSPSHLTHADLAHFSHQGSVWDREQGAAAAGACTPSLGGAPLHVRGCDPNQLETLGQEEARAWRLVHVWLQAPARGHVGDCQPVCP